MVAGGDKGIIVQGADGLPVFMVAGAGGTICVNNEPEMLLTVTGTSGTINWCGKQWILPADSGVQKIACPTNYFKGQEYTSLQGGYDGRHQWLADGLWLLRQYHVEYDPTNETWFRYSANQNQLQAGTSLNYGVDLRYFVGDSGATARPVPITSITTVASALNMILGVAAPEYSSYTITDDFFGSYSSGGITFSWAKGEGW